LAGFGVWPTTKAAAAAILPARYLEKTAFFLDK
jgi:hypothetical protein